MGKWKDAIGPAAKDTMFGVRVLTPMAAVGGSMWFVLRACYVYLWRREAFALWEEAWFLYVWCVTVPLAALLMLCFIYSALWYRYQHRLHRSAVEAVIAEHATERVLSIDEIVATFSPEERAEWEATRQEIRDQISGTAALEELHKERMKRWSVSDN